jgi:hypothetical protein
MKSTGWPPAVVSGARTRRAPPDRVQTTVRMLVASLLLAVSCARTDWIDRTLVTVDVTGTWYGKSEGAQFGRPGDFLLDLKQEGSTVTGFLRSGTSQGTSQTGTLSGPINGTVAGDVFRFRNPRGTVEGQLTVSGDEMTGLLSLTGTRPITLRRSLLGPRLSSSMIGTSDAVPFPAPDEVPPHETRNRETHARVSGD